MADFSTQAFKTLRAWSEMFQSPKENNFQSRVYILKNFKSGWRNKIFYDEGHLKKFMITKSEL